MKTIKPSYEILYCADGKESLKFIEKVAKTCYKSENKINDESYEKFIHRMVDNGHHAMIEFGFDIVVKFISNRGFSHELVRHRIGTSFAQESSRFCNYSKDKFGKEISIIEPLLNKWPIAESLWVRAMQAAEDSYMGMINLGVPAQLAREVLPIGLKTEIVLKSNIREWRHIFSLRCSKKAHPRMRQLMISLLHNLDKRVPIVFNDLANKYPIKILLQYI